MRKPATYSSLQEALKNAAQYYRRDLWDNQDVYVEIWTEKDAMAGFLKPLTFKWDVPLLVSRGFSSETYLYEAASYITEKGKPAYLYYFGDWDPSGVHIDRVIERKLREFAPQEEIHFERVAVTPEQIAELDLPTRPTKKTDSRSKRFKGESVEVDAIPPEVLRDIVEGCILRHVDPQALGVTEAAERSEKEIMKKLSRSLGKGEEEE
jgi:hypothetical protein